MITIDTDRPNHGLPYRGQPYPPGIIPRRSQLVYGSPEADRVGLVPVEAGLDQLIEPNDYKEVIERCIRNKIFAQFHQEDTWAPPGTVSDQNGFGWCWTFGGTNALMDVEALEDKTTIRLGANSMGWLVNWQNRGNYLESFITGAKERGIAPADMCGGWNSLENNPRNFHANWKEEALKHRLGTVWDTDARSGDDRMIQQCLSILAYGRPLYIAYNWWGHALMCTGVIWDESKYKNLIWVLRNSHGEREFIYLHGTKGIFDEAYGFISTIAA